MSSWSCSTCPGGGAVGWSQLSDMSADGHTIMGSNLPHIILKPMGKEVGFQTDDLDNFYYFHYSPDAILVRQDSPYETLDDLIQAANEAPGAVTLSGSGTYSANDVANTRFQQLADVTTTYIPFKGTGAAVTALLGGQVQAEWGYTTVAANHQDKVRMLAVAAEERHPCSPTCRPFRNSATTWWAVPTAAWPCPRERPTRPSRSSPRSSSRSTRPQGSGRRCRSLVSS